MGMLDSIKKALGDVAAEVRQSEQRIETLKQERERLESAPLSREELAAGLDDMLDAQVHNERVNYPKRLALALEGLQHDPFFEYADASLDLVNTLGKASDERYTPRENLLWFLGDLVKQRVRDAINDESFDWPDADAGPPLAERRTRITEIDREVEKLEQRVGEIRAEADRAGVRIE